MTESKRVRLCGWAPRSDAGVTVRVTASDAGRRAGLGNVQTCGSYWLCPVCAEKIALTRQSEVEKVLHWWHHTMGGRVAFVTLTLRHRKSHRLRKVWDVVSEAWRAAVGGDGWMQAQAVHGVDQSRVVKSGKAKGETRTSRRIRSIRVTETTVGDNGWHVHVHALLLVSSSTTDADVQMLAAGMFGRWSRVAKAHGLGAPTLRRGVDAKLLTGEHGAALADYFTKAGFSASHEVTGGMRVKKAKKANRTPFAVLADLLRDGLAEDLDLWQEWERGSKGRRGIAYSPGLLDEAGVRDVTDEEIVADEQGGEDVATVDIDTWRLIRQADAVCDLLEAFEVSLAAGHALLASWLAQSEPARRARAA